MFHNAGFERVHGNFHFPIRTKMKTNAFRLNVFGGSIRSFRSGDLFVEIRICCYFALIGIEILRVCFRKKLS